MFGLFGCNAVRPNQPFTVQWATGHGGWTYFVVLHADDEPRLRGLTAKLRQRYIDEAPEGANEPPRCVQFCLCVLA